MNNQINNIKNLLQKENATIVAHFYTPAEIQKLAEETGGCVADSLEMARFGAKSSAQTLVVAGVRFMGETAKILSPEKRIIMPTKAADCSLDLGCPADEFEQFCKQHPDRTVVVYANTSAAVKALADWTVTSSNAVDIISYLHEKGEKIIWAPERYLGSYIQKKTGADMLLWNSYCVVHVEFQAKGIAILKELYPTAKVLVHPESPSEVVELADVVGSTSKLLQASEDLPDDIFIVATDAGILYKMQQKSPNKQFIIAPTGGYGAVCKSCAHCPWMAMNTLDLLENCLRTGHDEIKVNPEIIKRAQIPLKRMLDFKKT